MIAQRAGAMAIRRAARKPSSLLAHNNNSTIVRSVLAAATGQMRPTSTATPATEKLSQPDSEALLASQRTKRPVAPHITAYDPMHIWLGTSIWQRFTGIGFAGLLYAYAGAYLVAPLAGWHLESATAVAAVAAWPLAAKGALKFVLAWPFVFHGINGTRHLINDLGLGYTKKEIKASGLAIWGTSLAAGLAIAFLI